MHHFLKTDVKVSLGYPAGIGIHLANDPCFGNFLSHRCVIEAGKVNAKLGKGDDDNRQSRVKTQRHVRIADFIYVLPHRNTDLVSEPRCRSVQPKTGLFVGLHCLLLPINTSASRTWYSTGSCSSNRSGVPKKQTLTPPIFNRGS